MNFVIDELTAAKAGGMYIHCLHKPRCDDMLICVLAISSHVQTFARFTRPTPTIASTLRTAP